MAAAPSDIPSITTNENTIPNIADDPFWSSTPRSVPLPPDIDLMMSAQQAVPVPPSGTPKPGRSLTTPARRPQCTHVSMKRLFGNHRCNFCNRIPEMGFVYSCQQDLFMQHIISNSSTEALPVVADSGDFFEAQAKVAESLGMSASVIKQMKEGHYSYDQTEKLLQQRRHVIEVIRKAETPSSRSSLSSSRRRDSIRDASRANSTAEVVISSAGMTNAPAVQPVAGLTLPMTPAGTLANSTATTPATDAKTAAQKITCAFQVCHVCRPFFPDRLHSSFEAVFRNEVPPISHDEQLHLRVLNAEVIKNFGLRPSVPKPRLTILPKHEDDNDSLAHMNQGDGYDDEYDDESPGFTPTDSTTSNDSRFYRDNPELMNELRALSEIEMARDRDRCRRSITTTTPGRTSSAGSSVSLPEPKIEPLTPTTPAVSPFGIDLENRLSKVGKAATVCGVLSSDGQYREEFAGSSIKAKDSNSSLGDEVEVDGGVALKEEAVEQGVPDIVTD